MSTDGWCSLAAETAIVPRTGSLLVTSDGGKIEKGVRYYYEEMKRVALIGSLPWNNEKIFSSSPNPFPSGLGPAMARFESGASMTRPMARAQVMPTRRQRRGIKGVAVTPSKCSLAGGGEVRSAGERTELIVPIARRLHLPRMWNSSTKVYEGNSLTHSHIIYSNECSMPSQSNMVDHLTIAFPYANLPTQQGNIGHPRPRHLNPHPHRPLPLPHPLPLPLTLPPALLHLHLTLPKAANHQLRNQISGNF